MKLPAKQIPRCFNALVLFATLSVAAFILASCSSAGTAANSTAPSPTASFAWPASASANESSYPPQKVIELANNCINSGKNAADCKCRMGAMAKLYPYSVFSRVFNGTDTPESRNMIAAGQSACESPQARAEALVVGGLNTAAPTALALTTPPTSAAASQVRAPQSCLDALVSTDMIVQRTDESIILSREIERAGNSLSTDDMFAAMKKQGLLNIKFKAAFEEMRAQITSCQDEGVPPACEWAYKKISSVLDLTMKVQEAKSQDQVRKLTAQRRAAVDEYRAQAEICRA